MIDKSKDDSEPPLDCLVRATMSLCCGIVHGGWKEPEVMHSGLCRDKHGGELGHTYYLTDSGLTMDLKGANMGLGWRPIKTAPKGGVDILAWSEHLGHLVVGWDDTTQAPEFNWVTADGLNYHKDAFSHWRPLPEAPNV